MMTPAHELARGDLRRGCVAMAMMTPADDGRGGGRREMPMMMANPGVGPARGETHDHANRGDSQ